MLCILCISVSNEMLNIFDENGVHLNIGNIITKHFWMKPNVNDNNSKAICCSCWKTLDSFHNFYQTIEEAHTKLTTCLKLPIEESDAESNHFEVFSDFFTPVVKLESSEDTKVEFPEPLETPSVHPNDTVAKNGQIQKASNSDSESEVPLLKLSNRTRSVGEDNKDADENSDNESDSDNDASVQDSGHQQQDSESDSGSDSGSDYNAPKKKAKVKASSKSDGSSNKLIPCREFDSFIKQNMKLECNICKKPVENFFCLKEHFKKAHKQTAYVTCCERQWTSRFSLVHHLLLHKNPDLYKCQKCGRVLANKKSFKNHTRSHVTQERIHKCPKCSKMFSSIAKLEKHSKTHIKPRIDQICEQCGKVCHSMQSLMAHQKREHLGFVKQRVQCPKCGTYLSDSSTLHTHMKYQHPKVEVLNVCKICGKISSTGYGLKRHMQYMHSMERKHKCNICEDKAFKTAQRLRPDANNPNAKVICTSCWAELNSFHEFYLQVEEAHASQLNSINKESDEDLKLENEITSEFLDSDIKLEVKEDAEVRLNADDDSAEPNESQSPSRESLNVNLEAPPASSTRSRKSVEKYQCYNDSSSEDGKSFDNTEIVRCNSEDWQNEDENSDNTEEDSDYDDNTSTSKANKSKEPTKKTKKRGRPRKGETRSMPCKKPRNSGEQNLKRKRMQEFDEIIAQNMKLSCAMCHEVFVNFAALKRHFRSEHNECGYVVCCTKKFRKRGVLVDHICTHQNPEYFKCEQCGRVLANRKGLDSHMLTHDTEKQRIYQCDQCTLSFYTRPLLTRHLQTHISERNIKCPDCDKFFSTQDILRTHVNNVHNAAYTRICDQCGKSFRRPDAFRRHQLEHDGITQPMVPCEKCNVKLTSKYGLKRHMESMHPEQDIKHICNECGKVAPSAAALQRHISYMHKMERKYKCPMCDKAFKKTGGLKPNKNDENARYICGSCWNTLYSFHKFYKQVEEAHLSLLTASALPDEDLKPENDQIAVEVEVRLIDKFDTSGDYSNTAVKLEVKDDGEICLQSIENSTEVDLKLDEHEIEQVQELSIVGSSDSDDSEIPLSSFTKTNSKKKTRTKATTTPSSNDDQESSAEWQDPGHSHDDGDGDDDDDEEDSDFEIKLKTTPVRKPQTAKKRGRPLKNAPRDAPRKEITEEQVKKQKLSHEYDDIIQKHMKLTCNICQLTLTNFFTLKKHYRCKHNERGYAFCCSKKFLKRGVLVDHIYTHLNPEHFKCDKCDKVLADRRCLEVHMNIHSEGKQRIYQCDQCNKSFFKKPLLTRHMHIHIPQEERKFHCEECNKFFPSNYTLRAHINNVHQNAYAKICDQCGKSIRGREAFQRHLLEHAGVAIPSVQCDKCGARLKNKYGLKRHMNAMHADKSVPHVCNKCGKVAPNAPALQRHYYYVHKCERSHKCPMCDKAFKKAAGLKEHMTTHTGEVLYTCPHCPKTFNSNANMHSHRKKMHRKEWEENRRHPHMGASSNANAIANTNTNANVDASVNATEENNQQ